MNTVREKLGLSGDAEQQVMFTIPLPNRDPVFMRQRALPYEQTHYSIVVVDSSRFVDAWRNCNLQREWPSGAPEAWRRNPRYPNAERGFAVGVENPVPLALVSYGVSVEQQTKYRFLWFGRTDHTESLAYINVVNGIMRTIWLLSNGCSTFPVLVDAASAADVFAAAGAPGTSLRTLGEIVQSLKIAHA